VRPVVLVALCLLAGGACNDKRASNASPSATAGSGSAVPTPDAAPVPDAADVVIHRAFAHASDEFAVSDAVLEYVRQDGTLDPTYGHVRFLFGHRPHPPPPPVDDPKRPIGAPVPSSAPSMVTVLMDRHDDCPRVTWEPGKLDAAASGASCEEFIPPVRVPLRHPRCGVREIWKRAIAKDAPAEALAKLELDSDLASEEARQVWKFTIEDAPRGIHIEERFADDCDPVVEQSPR
jgi:hypothetical protein